MRAERAVYLAAACALSGCAAADVGDGSLSIRISGEQAALSGYPVGDGAERIAFADGWTLEFHKLLISLSDLSLASSRGERADISPQPLVADLHQGAPKLWTFDHLAAQRWDRVGYRIVPPGDDARAANDVAESDIEHMRSQGYSMLIDATAKSGERQVELSWGFPLQLQLSGCENGVDGTDGVVVRENAQSTAEITVHLDHLFFDDWAVAEPKLRFEAMAAVAAADGTLTLDDLAAQDNLSDLRDADGQPLDLAYDPGSAFHPVPDNLEQWVTAEAETLGHWNGEGHCMYQRL